MREYLFRGKRAYNGKWIYGDLLHKGGNRETCPNTGREIYVSPYKVILTAMGDMFEVLPETVGQYTGLTDKNGVKIFEGDKFKIRGVEQIFEVQFCSGAFSVYQNGKRHGYLGDMVQYGIELIGNIHDNSNLLK